MSMEEVALLRELGEESAAKKLEAVHSRERRLQPLDCLASPYPSKVAGTRDRQQIEAQIGWRGTMCYSLNGRFLVVIWWEPMIFFS